MHRGERASIFSPLFQHFLFTSMNEGISTRVLYCLNPFSKTKVVINCVISKTILHGLACWLSCLCCIWSAQMACFLSDLLNSLGAPMLWNDAGNGFGAQAGWVCRLDNQGEINGWNCVRGRAQWGLFRCVWKPEVKTTEVGEVWENHRPKSLELQVNSHYYYYLVLFHY